ncbi:MAG: glycosyltransferase family 4 protein [Myxococcota bacterium]
MRFAFVMGSNFHVGSVDERPLGGSESAVCYLARALSAAGHQVTLFTFCSTPSVDPKSGAQTFPLPFANGRIHFPPDLLRRPRDVVVLKNGLWETAPVLRRHLRPEVPLWLWTGHAPDQPAMAALQHPEVVRAFDRFVFLTDWQRQETLKFFPGLPPALGVVLRHAIAPCFEGLFSSPESLRAAKTRGPLQIAYTSTPFRGLDILLDVWPEIHAAQPTATLKIHAGMEVYGVRSERDPHAPLYARATTLAGVERPGPLAQGELAGALRRYGLLAYPNSFPETGCIAVMEALAAGTRVVTSALGALPETSGGHARLVAVNSAFRAAFAQAVIEEATGFDDEEAWAARWAQVRDLNETCTWARRVEDWAAALHGSTAAHDRVGARAG